MAEVKTEEFKTSDDFKVVCTEHILPPCKFSPEVVIGETDTFVLVQLTKLLDIAPYKLIPILSNIEKECVVFFQIIDDETKERFINCRHWMLHEFEGKDSAFAYDRLTCFILTFLKNSIKRAEEKAKCQK